MNSDTTTTEAAPTTTVPKKRLDLLETEQGFICFDVFAAIACVTFFEGDPPLDYLKSRTREIVNANPWLCAKPSKEGGINHMVYPEEDLPDLFQSFSSTDNNNNFEGIDVSKAYDEICAAAVPLMCKKGSDVTEDDKGSFLVSVVNNPTKNTFALVVSMSHVVGDGHTFYTIHNMLSEKAVVESLDSKRDDGFLDRQKERMGEAQARGITDTPLVVRSLMGVIKLKVWTKTLVRQLHYVDQEYIKDQKEAYQRKTKNDNKDADAPKFVSTNDILTSWFYSLVKTKYSLMSINLRNRVKGITDNHAGNYENFIAFQHDNYQEPALIRKAVDSCGKANAYPSAWTRFWATPFGVCANWTSFDKGIDLPSGKQILHLPLYPEDSLNADVNICVIFRATRDKLAMLFMSDRGVPDVTAASNPMGEILDFSKN